MAEVTAAGTLSLPDGDGKRRDGNLGPMTRLRPALRALLVAAAALALAASASSRSSAPPPPPPGAWNAQPPQAQGMDPRASHGLWDSSFGPVKIEEESPGRVHGAWRYDRGGQEVIGYFAGTLDGNVLRLTWREPAVAAAGAPVLAGEGWLVFDPAGARFAGRWWTSNRDRQGDWNGWRPGQATGAAPPPPAGYGGDVYGGGTYGGAPTYPTPPPPY